MNRKLLPAMAVASALALPALAAEVDPTRPIDYQPRKTTAGNASGLTLQSLLVSKQRKRAVINGKRVEEGDRVAGATVVKITADGVTVERNGKRRTLKLNTTIVKKARGRAGD